jgi:phosphoglycerate kinase
MPFRTLDQLVASGKRVLLRADLNVPVKDGRISDLTRLQRLCPTIRELCDKGARVVICSHFGRPKGKRVPDMSLRPVASALEGVLGLKVRFAETCVGPVAEQAVKALTNGEVLVLENTRFDPREEKNDPAMAKELAVLADVYVNDAFSAAHRAHASTEGVASLLPTYAGRLMQAELEALEAVLGHPNRPLAAIIGGAKVSTKLGLLENLVGRIDVLVLGGAMANTFLAAQGVAVGRSMQAVDMHGIARDILLRAKQAGCEVILPQDAVVAGELGSNAALQTVPVHAIPAEAMILDLGPATVQALVRRASGWRTVVWNGPLGTFETPPFDAATTALAHAVAAETQAGRLTSVAGGGDTVAALQHAGAADRFTYVSSAGGAFLEWLEGRTLPGVAALGG